MRKIHILFAAAAAAVLAASCKPEPVLTVSPASIEVKTADSATESVSVTANYPWNASANASWVHLKNPSGTEEDKTLGFTVDANTTPDARSATITVTSEGLSQTVTVTQAQMDKLVLSSKEETVSPEGGTLTVKLQSNVSYTVEIQGGVDWLTKSGTKGMQDYTETFAVAPNDTYGERTCTITFAGAGLKEVVTVTQPQNDGFIVDGDFDYSFDANGGTFTVDLKSNIGAKVSIPEGDASWITQLKTKALDDYQFQFRVEKNFETKSRSGKIELTDDKGNVEATLTVFQRAKPYLTLSADSFLVDREASQVTVDVNTNVELDILVPEAAAGWLSVTLSEDGKQLLIDVAENPAAGSRYAVVTLQGKEDPISATLTVTQRGEDQMLSFIHNLRTVTAPAITGPEVSGTVDWGDKATEAYAENQTHKYAKNGTYTVVMTVAGGTAVEFASLSGILLIDLSAF